LFEGLSCLFANDVERLFVGAQPKEGGMPHLAFTRPLGEFYLTYQPRNKPGGRVLGYGTGLLAPGLKLPSARLNQVRRHAVLAHGLAVQAIRAKAQQGTQVGLAENIVAAWYKPFSAFHGPLSRSLPALLTAKS
jgi:hypothetical protein